MTVITSQQPAHGNLWREMFARMEFKRRRIVVYLGCTLLTSFLFAVALACFTLGVASIKTPGDASASRNALQAWGDELNLAPDTAWLVWFIAFPIVSAIAIAVGHLGTRSCMALLTECESSLKIKGLKLAARCEPRDLNKFDPGTSRKRWLASRKPPG